MKGSQHFPLLYSAYNFNLYLKGNCSIKGTFPGYLECPLYIGLTMVLLIQVKIYNFKIVFVILTCGTLKCDADNTLYIASFYYNFYNKEVIIYRCGGSK